MSDQQVSRVVEDYVARIWKAEEWGDTPSTRDLAVSVGVTPSTVSATLKKLARDGFIDYEPYGAVSLTGAGRAIAVQVVRRHRIVETYLVQALGMTWDEVHHEADALEHAISDTVLARMMDVLGHPDRDPHGDPIPATDGTVTAAPPVRLAEVPVGALVVIDRVSDREPELLRHVAARDLELGQTVRVLSVDDRTGLVTLGASEGDVELSISVARAVGVRLAD